MGERLKVLHVIPSVSPKEGGPSVAVRTMANALAAEGVEVTVATTMGRREQGARGKGEMARGEADTTLRSSGGNDRAYRTICFKRNFEPYKVSFGLARWLRENVAKFDLIHIHALFSFSSTVAARIARKSGVPYIVRPLGVLNQWGMQNRRRFSKSISLRLVELPILRNSAAIHYTSEAERGQATLLNSSLAKQDFVVIPLPVEGSEGQSAEGEEHGAKREEQRGGTREQFLTRFPEAGGKRIILFLSRIDPMKGLEVLLDTFAVVRNENKDVVLVVAGEGEERYVGKLKERASAFARDYSESLREQATATGRAEIGRREKEEGREDIIWTGHLSGEMKAAALAAADVFVLPSASENFGVAAAESLAAGVPTIVSEEVGISDDIRRCDAGIVVKRDAHELASAISDLLANKERAATLAANGRRLVQERYSSEAVGKALLELYQSLLEGRDKQTPNAQP